MCRLPTSAHHKAPPVRLHRLPAPAIPRAVSRLTGTQSPANLSCKITDFPLDLFKRQFRRTIMGDHHGIDRSWKLPEVLPEELTQTSPQTVAPRGSLINFGSNRNPKPASGLRRRRVAARTRRHHSHQKKPRAELLADVLDPDEIAAPLDATLRTITLIQGRL